MPLPGHFSANVVLYRHELKVIAHPEPLLLLGVDLLCSGYLGWDFQGIGPGSDRHGFMTFVYGHQNKSVPLLQAPYLANLGQPISQLLPPPPPAEQDEAGHSRARSPHWHPKKPAPEPAPPQPAAHPAHHMCQDPPPAPAHHVVDACLQRFMVLVKCKGQSL